MFTNVKKFNKDRDNPRKSRRFFPNDAQRDLLAKPSGGQDVSHIHEGRFEKPIKLYLQNNYSELLKTVNSENIHFFRQFLQQFLQTLLSRMALRLQREIITSWEFPARGPAWELQNLLAENIKITLDKSIDIAIGCQFADSARALLTALPRPVMHPKLVALQANLKHNYPDFLRDFTPVYAGQELAQLSFTDEYFFLTREFNEYQKVNKLVTTLQDYKTYLQATLQPAKQHWLDNNTVQVVARLKLHAIDNLLSLLQSRHSNVIKIKQFTAAFAAAKKTLARRRDNKAMIFLKVIATILAVISVIGSRYIKTIWAVEGGAVAASLDNQLYGLEQRTFAY